MAQDANNLDAEEHITLEWRGRDLAIIPPPIIWPLDDHALYAALFGPEEADAAPALLTRDRRARCLRARPRDFARLKAALTAHGAYPIRIAFDEYPLLPWQPRIALTPRPYQEEALTAWRAANYRGVVVLPTGAGKTFIGALAIADLGLRTLVVVPTIDLLRQWRVALSEMLILADNAADDNSGKNGNTLVPPPSRRPASPASVPPPSRRPASVTSRPTGVEATPASSATGDAPSLIGIFGGGEREIRPITIITYDSAQLHPDVLRHFGLLIFDECHHLPAPTYREIADGAFATCRLGLSATPERADEEHLALDHLIGPEVYRRAPATLSAARYLAGYDEQRLVATLSDADRARYDAAREVYRGYVRRRRLAITSPADFQRKILWASARDPEAREAMLAWRTARAIALNAPAKLELLEELFERHRAERVLVFSEYNTLVRDVSRRFCLPQITHDTPAEERRIILERFRSGRYSKLVTGRVLNEGVDIPDCGVAIIVSGNSTRREYIQRLGRILRPKETRATFYELVTEDTTEERVADRRRERS